MCGSWTMLTGSRCSGDGKVSGTRTRSVWSAGSIRTSLATPDATILGSCMVETQIPPAPKRATLVCPVVT